MNKFYRAVLVYIGLILFFSGLVYVLKPESTVPQGIGACVWHASEEASLHDFADILLIKYKNYPVGHAYCVYERDGKRFAWDWRGETEITLGKAIEIARQLEPPITGLVPETAQLIRAK